MNHSGGESLQQQEERRFPSCFPINFASEILPREAGKKRMHVFRLIKFGKINRDAFLSSYEEELRGLRKASKPLDPLDPSTYSTSCTLDRKELQHLLKMTLRHQPEAFIAEGETEGKHGPCQVTAERTGGKKNMSTGGCMRMPVLKMNFSG